MKQTYVFIDVSLLEREFYLQSIVWWIIKWMSF